MAQRAQSLADVPDVLDLEPLDFLGVDRNKPATDPAFYVEPPARDDETDGLPGLGPAERFRDHLLGQRQLAKLFLSGHVGSGKSTQLNKLAADEALRGAFSVILLRIDAGLVAFLDGAQLLVLMAGALFDFGMREGLLTEDAKWKGVLRELDAKIYGTAGVDAKEGTTSAELNLFFVKIRGDLKLSEHRRRQFRDLGETQQSILLDLLKALTLDIETSLVKQGRHHSLLLLVDDLDKVRGPEQQRDIFGTNLDLLFTVPFRALYTVPNGVVFGPSRAPVRREIEHLYPVRVLDKSPEGFDPEKAFIPGSDAFFRQALDQRVEPRLFDDASVRLAAIYSGGVLREFFRLLRSAVSIARYNKLDMVDSRAVRAAVRDERRRETMGLYASDYEALLAIHRTHEMAKEEDRRYLDEARVLECYNDRTWYEVNPLLWKVLEARGAS
jgi:hypothetical protein